MTTDNDDKWPGPHTIEQFREAFKPIHDAIMSHWTPMLMWPHAEIENRPELRNSKLKADRLTTAAIFLADSYKIDGGLDGSWVIALADLYLARGYSAADTLAMVFNRRVPDGLVPEFALDQACRGKLVSEQATVSTVKEAA